MWTTKETKREYRGVTIWKIEGSKVKDIFRRRDPRTFQKDDSRFTKWHSYQVEIFGIKYEEDYVAYKKGLLTGLKEELRKTYKNGW